MGLPYRVIVGKRTKEEGKFEVVERATGETMLLSEDELYEKFVTPVSK
jgi:prolyl-tRNA synthetase